MSQLEKYFLKFLYRMDNDFDTFQRNANYACIAGYVPNAAHRLLLKQVFRNASLCLHLYKNNTAQLAYDSLLVNNSFVFDLYKPLITDPKRRLF